MTETELDLIPIGVLRPVVEEWLATFENAQQAFLLLDTNSRYGADTWRKRLSGNGWFRLAAVDWSDIDEFLVAADATHLWRSTGLADYLPDGDAALTDAEHDAWCANCGQEVDWENDLAVRLELGEVVAVRRRWRWWTLCAVCAAECLPHRKARSGTKKISDGELLAFYRAYVGLDLGLDEIAEKVWEAHGFTSARACAGTVGRAWANYGWPRRSSGRTRTLKYKHGRKGEGRLQRPQLDVLWRIYTDERIGIWNLAELVWERLGFPNQKSCMNAIAAGFRGQGRKPRDRDTDARVRTVAGRRRMGFGRKVAKRGRGRILTASEVDALRAEYDAGASAHAIAREHFERLGYPDWGTLRQVLEHAWKAQGLAMRSNREARLLELADAERDVRCKGKLLAGKDPARKPRKGERCNANRLADSDYCQAHDERFAARRERAAVRLKEVRKERGWDATVPWETLEPLLAPLMVPRPDRFGRTREQAGGALARSTGVAPSICSRLVKGRSPMIGERLANRLLAPLGLTWSELQQPAKAA